MFVCQGAGKFQVRNGNGAVTIVIGHQSLSDGRRKRKAPYDGGLTTTEAHSSHAALAGHADTMCNRDTDRNEFAKLSWAVPQGVPKMGQAVENAAVEPNLVAVAPAQRVPKGRKQTACARQSSCHGAEELVPLGCGSAFPCHKESVNESGETINAMLGEVQQCSGNSIHVLSQQDGFPCGPTRVPLEKLFDRHRLFPTQTVG